MSGLVQFERREAVAVLTLNRPQHHNALVPELLDELLDAVHSEPCQTARALLLQARGPSFSTGGDLRGFWRHREALESYSEALVGRLNRTIIALWSYPAPVACAVQGQVTGGALGLLLAADHVVMAPAVTVTPWYSRVGFSPDGGWTALLPELIGRRATAHWLYHDETRDAAACKALGLAQEVTGDAAAAALEWAQAAASGQPASARSARRLLNAGSTALQQRLEAERAAFVQQICTSEARAGIRQFIEGSCA